MSKIPAVRLFGIVPLLVMIFCYSIAAVLRFAGRSLLVASLVLPSVLDSAASAQTFSSPPDAGTYQPRAATYAAGTTLNVIGDGSNAKGGVAPAFTTHPEPAETNDNPDPAWISGGGISACVAGAPGCPEKKWRTSANSCSFKQDDPIRFWGQPGVSHLHEFFGNCEVNAYSTRASLRIRNKSLAAGGPWQATGYWEPAWLKTLLGKLYAMFGDDNIIYYAEDANNSGGPQVDDLQPLHLLLRFVGGVNPDDPDDLEVKAEIAAANAQPGTAGRYSYAGNGWAGYVCLLADGSQATVKGGGYRTLGFTLDDGTDPWEGRCVAGSQIYSEFNAPRFWDCWNVSSPTGTKHFRYGAYDAVAGQVVGPNGWCKVGMLQGKTKHRTQGWNDYRYWSLSSDPMMAAKLGRAVRPGASFHFDWMNGHHKATLARWQSYCLGIGSNQPHQCDYSTIDATGRFISDSAAPDGSRNPHVNLNNNFNTNDPAQMHLVDPARAGMIHMRGN